MPMQDASVNGEPSPLARVITVGKRRWVAGMLWRSFEEKPSRSELRQEGADLQSEWATLRVGEDAIQAGFCAPVDGLKRPKKLFSIAAAVADSQKQPWLGIYKIEDGLWWYIAVRDGQAILPDGDVIGGEEAIYAARERHSGFGDWNYVEGSLDDLAALVQGIKPSPVFALHGVPDELRVVAGVAVIIAAAGAGGFWWHERQLAAEHARALAIARMHALMEKKQEIKAPLSPLVTTPMPNDWVSACDNAIENLPVSQDGWTLSGISCAGNVASIIWQRMPGATTALRPQGTLDHSGNKVEQTISLKVHPVKGRDNGQPLPVEQSDLFAMLQGLGVKVTIQSASAPEKVTLPGEKPVKTIATPPPQSPVHFTLPIAPFSMNWDAIPGFRISRIVMRTHGWHIEGVLYGR